MSRLTVRDLVKGYGGQPVLRGVDLDVEPGSLTAVLGLSGCGKTTLLRVIAGFERAERGRVALGLVSFSVRYALALYQSSLELIVAYAILFLPLAVVVMRSAMAQASPRLEEVGRSLGCRPVTAWWRITLPLIAPSLRAAFALVFITSATELTATLLLRPTGVNTLATQFWAYTTDFSYGAAAPYAALMVAISAVPAYLLSRRMANLSGERP